MKVVKDTESSTIMVSATLQSKEFHMNANAAAFVVLSDTLYSRKNHAVLREVGVNAIEAHQMIEREDLPIEVMMPTKLDPTFYIKDFGPGLNHASAMRLYGGYFESTKSGDDKMAGGFGLGSKSPFAVTDSFTVISSHDGVRRVYMAYRKAGVPNLDLRSETPIAADDAWPHGIMVSFPVKPENYAALNSASVDVFRWFPVMPKVLRGTQKYESAKCSHVEDGFTFGYTLPAEELDPLQIGHPPVKMEGSVLKAGIGREHYSTHGPITVVIGPVAYPVKLDELKLDSNAAALTNAGLVLWLPIGTVQVAPSREALSYSTATATYLSNAINKLAALLLTRQLTRMNERSTTPIQMWKLYQEAKGWFSHSSIVDSTFSAGCPAYRAISSGVHLPESLLAEAEIKLQIVSSTRGGKRAVRSVPLHLGADGKMYTEDMRQWSISGETVPLFVVVDVPRGKTRLAAGEIGKEATRWSQTTIVALYPKQGVTVERVYADVSAKLALLGAQLHLLSEFLPKEEEGDESSTKAGDGSKGSAARRATTKTEPLIRLDLATGVRKQEQVDLDDGEERVYLRFMGNGATFELSPSFTVPHSYTDTELTLKGLGSYTGLDYVWLADPRVAGRLATRDTWQRFDLYVADALDAKSVTEWVTTNPALCLHTLKSNQSAGWLWRDFWRLPLFKQKCDHGIPGTRLLKLLEETAVAFSNAHVTLAVQGLTSMFPDRADVSAAYRMLLTEAAIATMVAKLLPAYEWIRPVSRDEHGTGEGLEVVLGLIAPHLAKTPEWVASTSKRGAQDTNQLHLKLVA